MRIRLPRHAKLLNRNEKDTYQIDAENGKIISGRIPKWIVVVKVLEIAEFDTGLLCKGSAASVGFDACSYTPTRVRKRRRHGQSI